MENEYVLLVFIASIVGLELGAQLMIAMYHRIRRGQLSDAYKPASDK